MAHNLTTMETRTGYLLNLIARSQGDRDIEKKKEKWGNAGRNNNKMRRNEKMRRNGEAEKWI